MFHNAGPTKFEDVLKGLVQLNVFISTSLKSRDPALEHVGFCWVLHYTLNPSKLMISKLMISIGIVTHLRLIKWFTESYSGIKVFAKGCRA